MIIIKLFVKKLIIQILIIISRILDIIGDILAEQ